MALFRTLHGAPKFLTTQDRRWLRKNYPELSIKGENVLGKVNFTATYNDKSGHFLVLKEGVINNVGGKLLRGNFDVGIRRRTKIVWSALPAVYVKEVDPVSDRHFNQLDKSACLCSPLEEKEFLTPEFQFQKFFEELLIPFLYGQAFYSLEDRWPWSEYTHGLSGLLESYLKISDPLEAQECVQKLSLDKSWPKIKSALIQKAEIKGHLPCFCPKADRIRRCHPNAWMGLKKLRYDIQNKDILIP